VTATGASVRRIKEREKRVLWEYTYCFHGDTVCDWVLLRVGLGSGLAVEKVQAGCIQQVNGCLSGRGDLVRCDRSLLLDGRGRVSADLHSHARGVAAELALRLQQKDVTVLGFEVWVDPRRIGAGDAWTPGILVQPVPQRNKRVYVWGSPSVTYNRCAVALSKYKFLFTTVPAH
jgi:hypothetical protein